MSCLKRKHLTLGALLLTPICMGAQGHRPGSTPAPTRGHVSVILWFDTEDYILPQDDDATKRLAEFLTRQGVRATFKVVGEKGRELEQRGRKDVIAAVNKHELGYHTNYHSQHPTVAEFEEPLGWENGVEEFVRREKPGLDDLHRIFGRMPTCYGQAGGSWAPEMMPGLKKMGVNVYLDEAPDVGLDGKPFWYGGILNIFNTTYGFKLRPNNDWSNLEEVEALFKQAYSEMVQNGGGIISIHFHPCEFVHREFWDAVNFAHGADPPREQWKLPPVKSPEESARAFKYFEDFVACMKSFSVQFITASQALKLFADRAQTHTFSVEEISTIAGGVGREVSFQVRDDYSLSASETFSLLNRFVAGTIRKKPFQPLALGGTPYGPSSASTDVVLRDRIDAPWYKFSRAVLDVDDCLAKTGQIPSVVWVGSRAVPPESYIEALAHVAETLIATGKPPEPVSLAPAHLATAQYVPEDSPSLWDWPIYASGFDGRHLLDLARLQTWTLKPAILHAP